MPPAVNTHVRSRQAFLLEVNQAPTQERAAFLEPETFKMQVLIFYSFFFQDVSILNYIQGGNCDLGITHEYKCCYVNTNVNALKK